MILVFGANGQLGTDIVEKLSRDNLDFLPITRDDIDIEKTEELRKFLKEKEYKFLINCTSYHKTEEVEENPAKAFTINAKVPKIMAVDANVKNAVFFHVSTDYVFGATQQNTPLNEESAPGPLNIYGSSKLMGENLIKINTSKYYILRVASLFGVAGASGKGGNFVEAIISKAKNKEDISVVDDQIMSPTSTDFIAKAIVFMVNKSIDFGIYNVVNKGEVSWHEFASEVMRILSYKNEINKISSSSLDLKAKRPFYSALSAKKIESLGLEVPTYQQSLKEYLKIKGHIK